MLANSLAEMVSFEASWEGDPVSVLKVIEKAILFLVLASTCVGTGTHSHIHTETTHTYKHILTDAYIYMHT